MTTQAALRFGLVGTGYWASETHAAGIADAAMQGARMIAAGPFGTAAWQLPVSSTSDTLTLRATGYFGFAQELKEGVAILDGLTYSG